MVQGLLGRSVLNRKVRGQLGQGVRLLENPRGSFWKKGGAALTSRAVPCSATPPPAPPRPSRLFLGREDPGPGPRAQGTPCNRSFRTKLRGMWTRHRREAGTCGGRAWQPPREQPVLGGAGAGRAERGNSVREERFGCAQRWAPAKAPESPPPTLRGRRAGCAACRWGLAS